MLDERDGTRERPDHDDPHPHTPSSTGADPRDGPSLPPAVHRTPQPAPGQPADDLPLSVGDAGPAPALSSGPARPTAPAHPAPAVVPAPCAASRMEPGRGAARSRADDGQTGRAEADVAGNSAGASLSGRRSPAPARHRSPPSPPPGSPSSSSVDPLLSPGPSSETHNMLAPTNRISISDTNPYNSDPSALTTDQPIEASMGETLPSALDARPSSPPSSVSASSLSSSASHIPPTSSSSPQPPPSSLPPPPPMQTLVGEPSTSASADSHIQPRALLSLLCCPLCPPRTLLRSPVTLHCGHTICADHLHTARSPPVASTSSASPAPAPGAPSAATAEGWATPCPLPTCSRPSPQEAPTFIHPDAHVGLIRPPAAAPFVHASDSPLHPHIDVTVNKLIDLVRRTVDAEAQADQDHTRRVFGPGDDDDDRTDESDGAISEGGDEDEAGDDADCPGRAGPSSHARPHMSSPRPRKRRRLRHIPRTRSRPATPPRPPEARADTDADGETRFEKELKSELLCEICFAMMWQPVTTPCQHVRLSFPAPSLFFSFPRRPSPAAVVSRTCHPRYPLSHAVAAKEV
ncbi:hypothetical protein EIP86_001790 [Pleurotus ostreatoroseus]|nr:hypothetical protein EIP86_001790 [Pleurotus ostreatoroseus]